MKRFESKLDSMIEKARQRDYSDFNDEVEVDFEDLGAFIEEHNEIHVEKKLPYKPFSGFTNITFRPADAFFFVSGALQGAMGAVPSNTYSYQCSKNAT